MLQILSDSSSFQKFIIQAALYETRHLKYSYFLSKNSIWKSTIYQKSGAHCRHYGHPLAWADSADPKCVALSRKMVTIHEEDNSLQKTEDHSCLGLRFGSWLNWLAMNTVQPSRVAASASASISASTFFPGLDLGLDGFGFEAEADNSGQSGHCCLLHASTTELTINRLMYQQL